MRETEEEQRLVKKIKRDPGQEAVGVHKNITLHRQDGGEGRKITP